jgi:hypothetical protein
MSIIKGLLDLSLETGNDGEYNLHYHLAELEGEMIERFCRKLGHYHGYGSEDNKEPDSKVMVCKWCGALPGSFV